MFSNGCARHASARANGFVDGMDGARVRVCVCVYCARVDVRSRCVRRREVMMMMTMNDE